jgi:NAD+ synthase (glutamine-hydrolysing)
MKIAIAQLNPVVGDIVGNALLIEQAAQAASAQGVQLLITPELSLCGYPPRDFLLYPGFVATMQQALRELAAKLPQSLAVLVGIVEINPQSAQIGQKPLFNSAALLQGGSIQQTFQKQLLPTYDVFDEDRYFEPGRDRQWFSLADCKIGVTICEDLWNEEAFWGKRSYEQNPLANLAAEQVDFVVNLSASPYCLGKSSFREAMIRHSVERYHLPIVYVNQVGGNDDLIFDGSSFALDREGALCLRSLAFLSDFHCLTWQGDRKNFEPAIIHPASSCPEAELWQALVLGVKDYVQKSGFSQVILGLSGGIDSALVAAIAAEAVGAKQVLGVMMPSPYSSAHSLTDAEALVKNLGIQSLKLPIQDMMSAFDHSLQPLFAGTPFGIAEENLQSRIRGNLLMAIANKFGHLLLSTGNKSEIAVGYCTLYGDMNGGLAVIADLPKTQVFALCHWLNRAQEWIPAAILSKPPSAELKPNQVDQDSLPPYDVLDEILERYIHQHQSLAEMVAKGCDRETVEKVIKLVIRSEFKRRQAPPGLKVTDRAFGTGWRMPIASRWPL